MVKVKLKIGRHTFQVTEKDLVLDNGSCAQVVSQEIFRGWGTYAPIMSKKMFKEMKKLSFLYTNDDLKDRCHKKTWQLLHILRFRYSCHDPGRLCPRPRKRKLASKKIVDAHSNVSIGYQYAKNILKKRYFAKYSNF